MKKHFYKITACSALLVFALFAFTNKANACIDPDTVITVSLQYSEDFTDIEIRLGNMKLMTEQPNTFCSCALSGVDEVFTNPTYIAFVYEGTNDPYPSFEVWENTQGADDAWNNEFPNFFGWSGYIAEVINSGLSTDDKVDMVIRASTPPGYFAIVEEMDSAMAELTLGTDMWLPDEQTMAFDHTGMRNLRFDNSSFEMNLVPDEYFEALDGGILSPTNEPIKNNLTVSIAPNPVSERLKLNFEMPNSGNITVLVRYISGQLMAELYQGNLPQGEQQLDFNISAVLPKHGLYFLEIKTEGFSGVRKFVR